MKYIPLKRHIKARLSQLKFALGLNPSVERVEDPAQFVPQGYRGVVTVTADFELAWAPRYDNSVDDPYAYALGKARQERQNIPGLLSVCEQYQIPITWATVGHLFLASCQSAGGLKHPEIPAVEAYEGPYWDFNGKDWFEHDPCTRLEEAPEWYAPDLIDQIIGARTAHEIGCHTFSHIDCRDEVCPPALFESELALCKQLAEERSLQLVSFVHPGHTIGNLDTLSRMGFTSFQSDPGNVLGYPCQHDNGLWELKRTMEFTYRPDWTIDYHIQRYCTIVDRAIQKQAVCNFWFHPSCPAVVVEEILPGLFSHISERRSEVWVGTVQEYVGWLNRNPKQRK
mgnify:CR=1 FL=1